MRIILLLSLIFYYLNAYSQKKEIQFDLNPSMFFKVQNLRNIHLSIHYKYIPNIKYFPIKEPFILMSGIEYLQKNNDSDKAVIKKLMVPVILNFSRGDEYRLYSGIGIYASTNFNQKKIGASTPTLFQIGGSFNLGFQFKIKGRMYFNTEFKFIRDLTRTFILNENDRSGEEFISYKNINIGCTYRLIKSKR